MDEGPPPKKRQDPPPALPPSGLPVLAPSDRPALSPPDSAAMAPSGTPALAPSDRPAIASGPATASLPESDRASLPAVALPATDPQRDAIEAILRGARTVAVVGASDKPGRPAHRVTFYLMRAGFDVYPVNPAFKELGGRPAYPDLKAVPVMIDIVDVFRRPEQVPSVVDDAIAVGAKAVWMQEGIVNEEAAARARAAGLRVVMDRCVMKEHRRMKGGKPLPVSGLNGALPR